MTAFSELEKASQRVACCDDWALNAAEHCCKYIVSSSSAIAAWAHE